MGLLNRQLWVNGDIWQTQWYHVTCPKPWRPSDAKCLLWLFLKCTCHKWRTHPEDLWWVVSCADPGVSQRHRSLLGCFEKAKIEATFVIFQMITFCERKLVPFSVRYQNSSTSGLPPSLWQTYPHCALWEGTMEFRRDLKARRFHWCLQDSALSDTGSLRYDWSISAWYLRLSINGVAPRNATFPINNGYFDGQ